MASTPKEATDLLWAYQLKREHRHLLSRVEAQAADSKIQADRLAAIEHAVGDRQDARVDTLEKEVKALRASDAALKAANLEQKLQHAQKQVDELRDQLANAEKAHRKDIGDNYVKHDALLGRIVIAEEDVVQMRVAVSGLEEQFHSIDHQSLRAMAETQQEESDEQRIALQQLDERLVGLEKAQAELHTLLGQSRKDAPPCAVEVASACSTNLGSSKSKEVRARKEPTATYVVAQKKSARNPNARFEKEISQLIYGDGSLTNAPLVSRKRGNEPLPGNNRKRKPQHAEEEVSLAQHGTRSQKKEARVAAPKVQANVATQLHKEAMQAVSIFTQRETRSQAKEPNNQLEEKAVAKPRPKPPARDTVKTDRVAKGRTVPEPAASQKPGKRAAPERRLPVAISSAKSRSDVQVPASQSQQSLVVKLPLRVGPKAGHQHRLLVLASPTAKAMRKRHAAEQRPQKRRRIEQEESMEEFLAKCQTVTGIRGGLVQYMWPV